MKKYFYSNSRYFPLQTTETVEAIVSQLLEKQRTARMTGSLDCSDPDSTCLDSKSCIHQVTTTSSEQGLSSSKIFSSLLKPRLRRRRCLAAAGGAEAGGGAA